MKEQENFDWENTESKRPTQKPKKKSSGITGVVVCLGISLVVFIALILFENAVVRDVEKQLVVVSVCEIPDNLYVSADNAANFFAVKERTKSEIPEGALGSLDVLYGKYVDFAVSQNTIMTGLHLNEFDFYEGIENPVEMAIGVTNLSQIVGGVLREGDLIDIDVLLVPESTPMVSYVPEVTPVNPVLPGYGEDADVTEDVFETVVESVEEESETVTETSVSLPSTAHECYSLLKNVRVTRAFTSNGEKLTAQRDAQASADGDVVTAMIINIVVPGEMKAEVNRAVTDGTLRISKVITDGR